MALGTVNNVGMGSSDLNLKATLEALKAVDEIPIKQKETTRDRAEVHVTALDSLNARLIQMKSSALSLSLNSNFLERAFDSSDADVATATGVTGTVMGSHKLSVEQLATKSSWQSQTGFDSGETLVYGEPATDLADENAVAVTADTPVELSHGGGEKISIAIPKGATLKEMAEAINTSGANRGENGEPRIKASVVKGEDGAYIRMEAARPDGKTNQQILVHAGPEFLKPDLTFTYKNGAEGETIYTNIKAGTTYDAMAVQMNRSGDNTGIRAEVINDGSSVNGYRFTLTARETGESGRIFLEGLAMDELQGAEQASLNAKFSVDGIHYQRTQNENLDEVVKGLNLSLKAEGDTTLEVKSDTGKVKDGILDLVQGFIDFSNDILLQTTRSPESEDQGQLNDLGSIRTLQDTVSSMMTRVLKTDGAVTSLYDMGLSIDRDGKISLDEKKLDTMLAENPDAVETFFLGDKERELTGFADLMNDELKEMSGNNGTLMLKKTAEQAKVDRLTETIEDDQKRLEKRYETLTQQFIELDKVVSSLSRQEETLKNLIDAFNNADSKE